jgi:hypothetical protein
MISSLLFLLPISLQQCGEHQSTAVLPGLRVQRYRWAMLVRLASSLLLGTTLLLAAKLDPGWAQTSLDTGITGEQTLPQAPPLPDNRPAIFVDAANGSDTRGDGSRNNPFKTITYAIQRAEAGSVIQLFPGVYSEESGETFPIRLKAGLTLRGDESTLGEGYLITGGGYLHEPNLGATKCCSAGRDRRRSARNYPAQPGAARLCPLGGIGLPAHSQQQLCGQHPRWDLHCRRFQSLGGGQPLL